MEIADIPQGQFLLHELQSRYTFLQELDDYYPLSQSSIGNREREINKVLIKIMPKIDAYHSVPVVRCHVSSLGMVPCSFTVRYSVEVRMSSLEKKSLLKLMDTISTESQTLSESWLLSATYPTTGISSTLDTVLRKMVSSLLVEPMIARTLPLWLGSCTHNKLRWYLHSTG